MKLRHFMCSATLFLCASASSHTHLVKSNPADKAVLTFAPKELQLQFSEPTRLTALTVEKSGATTKETIAGLPKEATANIRILLTSITSGSYTVSWRALSKDNHVMKGALRFTVKGQ